MSTTFVSARSTTQQHTEGDSTFDNIFNYNVMTNKSPISQLLFLSTTITF